MFSCVGFPKQILSDNGAQFVSRVMSEVSRLILVKQLFSSPYHPMANGLCEKFNGTLKKMLLRMCNEQPREWDRYMEPLLFAYREVPQESTLRLSRVRHGRTERDIPRRCPGARTGGDALGPVEKPRARIRGDFLRPSRNHEPCESCSVASEKHRLR